MFGELPKLFDRNFAVGFLLPAALLAGGLWLVFAAYGHAPPPTLAAFDELSTAALAVGGVWLLALLLMAINYPLLRLLEGYPVRALHHRLRPRWPRLVERLEARMWRRFDSFGDAREHQEAIEAARAAGEPDPATPDDHASRMRAFAETLPAKRQHVLPTRFGNLFRAFEVYSVELYELDAIPAWPRLSSVIPADFRVIIADAKAQVDFCANLVLIGTVLAVAYVVLAFALWRLPEPWLAAGGLALALGGYRLALGAAAQFGNCVRTAFDLYRVDLARALGLKLPRSIDAEREMWRTVSRMMIYRSPVRAAELGRFRRHDDAGS